MITVLLALLLMFGCYETNTTPNIIIMFMDDMGWGDIGVYGHPSKETPNIDKMAEEGMLFTNFYSAAPICSPSRAALMTGRLPIRNGFYTTNRHGVNAFATSDIVGGINETEYLMPQLLKDAGYNSKIIGKWHLGQQTQYLPLNRGFDEFYGSPDCHLGSDQPNKPNPPVFRNDKMLGRYYTNFTIDHGLSNMTQIFIEEGVNFIDEQVKADTPFFLYWTPDANHQPAYASEMFRGKSIRDTSYGDSVMEIDYGVGVILDKLRELQIENNTFVFFSSDNGAELFFGSRAGSNGPLLCGKQTTFEGGMREPGIAWWPGTIPAGQVTHQLGSTMDLLVTALVLAGLDLPTDRLYDGINIYPILSGENENIERAIWYYRGNEMFAVRVGRFKAHYWTWSHEKYKFCPGQYVENVTTPHQVNRTDHPIVFDIEEDPGELYMILRGTKYEQAMQLIQPYVDQHRANMVPGEPSLNYCDKTLMNWAPPGCEEVNCCLPVPTDDTARLCVWDH